MATRRLRKGVWYIDYRANGKRRRKSTKTRNRKLAEEQLTILEAQLIRGELGKEEKEKEEKSRTALLPWFHEFRNHIDRNYVRADCEIKRLLTWQDYFRQKRITQLDQINEWHLQDFLNTVLTKHSKKTQRNYIGLLKTCLNHAVKARRIESNPIITADMPKVPKVKPPFFTKKEVAALIREANEPLKTAIVILVNTGMRRSELYYLRWEHVDLRRKHLTVTSTEEYTTKNKEVRTIPLNDSVLQILRELKKSAKSEYVYQVRSKGNFTDRFRELVRRLKMKGNLHTLRHTFASHLVMSGTPIPVVKELLGHADISMTMRYSHLSPDIHAQEVKKLKF